jgi:polysaccharide export outer membrane protein
MPQGFFRASPVFPVKPMLLLKPVSGVHLLCVIGLCLTGCGLPRGGPVQQEVLRSAGSETAGFGVVAVQRSNLAKVAQWPHLSTLSTSGWPQGGKGSGTSEIIAAGDHISMTVWESDDSPLLTELNKKSVTIPDMTVTPKGTIFVPYVGEVEVAGQSPDHARATVQEKLTAALSSPQVQLGVTPGRQNTVDLVGGVNRAGSYPLPDRNFSVLSLLSQGGGVPPGLRNPQLRLLRGTKTYGISVHKLLAEPQLDAVLRGGDKVIVEEDRRYFLSLGAAVLQNQIHFPQDDMSALDAVALIGGIAPVRANPKAILIMRDYPASALRRDGSGPDQERMVFTLDLTSADGLFSAREFQIEPKDVVLVTESPINGLRTLIGLLGQSAVVVNQVEATAY